MDQRKRIVYGSVLGVAVLALMLAVILLWQKSETPDAETVHTPPVELSSPGDGQDKGDIQGAGDSEGEDEDEDGPGTFRLRTSAYAFDAEPDAAWDYGSMQAVLLPADGEYELLHDDGGIFVKIGDGQHEGWVLRWYIEEDPNGADVRDVDPYEMIVFDTTDVYAYPDEQAPTGYELQSGRVIQVVKQYRDWVAVDFKLYAEPMTGERWIPMAKLIDYDENFANEGYLRIDWDGSYIYDEASGLPKKLIDRTQPIIVSGEQDGMYDATLPGGVYGLVLKEDFIPNPFTEPQVTHLGLSAEAKIAFDRFRDSRDDEDLRGIQPIELYKMYHHAIILSDTALIYDLYANDGEEYVPDRESYLLESRDVDEGTRQRTLDSALALQHIETEEIATDDEDIVVIRPLNADAQSWFFRLRRTLDGIWKVSWLPIQ